jgi:hypothetical protein
MGAFEQYRVSKHRYLSFIAIWIAAGTSVRLQSYIALIIPVKPGGLKLKI